MTDCQTATVEASKSWTTECRAACIALLEDAAKRIDEAASIWEEVLEAPDESGVPFTALIHIGPERARLLQRLHFEQKALAAELTELTGAGYRDTLGMDDSIAIVQPYDQMRDDESIHERARIAIATLQERRRRVTETVAALQGCQSPDNQDL